MDAAGEIFKILELIQQRYNWRKDNFKQMIAATLNAHAQKFLTYIKTNSKYIINISIRSKINNTLKENIGGNLKNIHSKVLK